MKYTGKVGQEGSACGYERTKGGYIVRAEDVQHLECSGPYTNLNK